MTFHCHYIYSITFLGGSIALNLTHLNLTRLAEYADDEIFVKLYRKPSQGWLERIDELPEFRTAENDAQISVKKEANNKEDEIVDEETTDNGNQVFIYIYIYNLYFNRRKLSSFFLPRGICELKLIKNYCKIFDEKRNFEQFI
jgi:hypothetical protein